MWELDYKESWVLKNLCFWTVVLEKTLESPLDCKEIQPVHLKEISLEYSLEGLMLKLKLQYLTTWCEELTHLKRPWCWERLKAGGEGGDSGWDGWMVSPIQWTWVWVGSRSWWWTGRPDVLRFMGSERVGHDWVTELNCPFDRYGIRFFPRAKSHSCPEYRTILFRPQVLGIVSGVVFYLRTNPQGGVVLPALVKSYFFFFSFFIFYFTLLLLLSHFSRVQLCATPSLGFSRQEHWSVWWSLLHWELM